MIDAGMIEVCAPHVAPATIQHIIRVESGGDPLAININPKGVPGGVRLQRKPTTAAEAAKTVNALLARYPPSQYPNFSIDLGLMQVNTKNLPKLGYSVEEMFAPCTNVAAGASVLTNFYRSAVRSHAPGQPALLAALSAYNTGSFTSGFRNGYVAKYTNGAQPAAVRVQRAEPFDPFTEETTVFIRQENQAMTATRKESPVFSRSVADAAIPGVQVEVDAADAEQLGAFEESAIGDADAWDANADLDAADTTPAAAARDLAAGNVVALKDHVKQGGNDVE